MLAIDLVPSESLRIRIEWHRGQFHNSGLFYLSDPSSRLCITSRHTRRNAQGDLVTLSNQELARLERMNRQQPRPTNTTMGDHGNQDDLASAMAFMQQMQQTMQTCEQVGQQAAEQGAQKQDFMTQTTERAFALIENMASSSANKNPETDRFMALTRKK
ncbi:hypothetical protein IGI04_023549 [Brassica rapa subsp. trilocularis]|uniref:Uncharacterized protein n=1 Tax=Brassica rapa subsp. trilocularis TaxID=1813537 RepID=A0ABQ7M463_BRACM|nr:hypothetical protein IGI04_023549 [Brassica rapa subsp. trilocularis]